VGIQPNGEKVIVIGDKFSTQKKRPFDMPTWALSGVGGPGPGPGGGRRDGEDDFGAGTLAAIEALRRMLDAPSPSPAPASASASAAYAGRGAAPNGVGMYLATPEHGHENGDTPAPALWASSSKVRTRPASSTYHAS
jgi:hypothetical protein